MKRLYTLIFFFAFAFSFQPLRAGDQNDFCSVLKEVMAASSDGFKHIMTGDKEEKTDFFGKVTVYKSNMLIPGALSANINKGIKVTYQALMGADNSQSAKLNDLYYTTRDNIKACLGSGYKFSEVKDDLNNATMFKAQANTGSQKDLYQPVVGLRYGKDGNNQYQVVLEVEEPFFNK